MYLAHAFITVRGNAVVRFFRFNENITVTGESYSLLQRVCSLVNISHGPCYATFVTLKRLQHQYGADALCGEKARDVLYVLLTHLVHGKHVSLVV